MPIRGVGRAAKRCCSLPLADARGLPDAMEHCSKRDTRVTSRHAPEKSPCDNSRPDQTGSGEPTDFRGANRSSGSVESLLSANGCPEQLQRCRNLPPARNKVQRASQLTLLSMNTYPGTRINFEYVGTFLLPKTKDQSVNSSVKERVPKATLSLSFLDELWLALGWSLSYLLHIRRRKINSELA